MSYYKQAGEFIAKKEGFNETAKIDGDGVYRIGHGSDTITFNDGTYRKVKVGDTTTTENAKVDLTRRIPEFEKSVINYINSQSGVTKEQWDDLPDPAKVGLLSFAYNYGNIVKVAIREAIKTGDVDKIADALLTSTANDNKKYSQKVQDALRKRRKEEAELIRSVKSQNTSNKNYPFVKNTLIIALILVSSYVLVKLYKKDAIPF